MTAASFNSARLFGSMARGLALPQWLTWPAVGFALRTTTASLVALYIAFLLNLDDPKWAPMTVWIVAQSSRGMSLSKGQYRILGTGIGAVAAVTMVALFAQVPELFVLSLALWLGLCTAFATGLRNFRAYGAVLAGYTAAIIAFDSISSPPEVFDIAIARVIYIGLGIMTEAVFTTIFAPGAPLQETQGRLATYLRQVADLCARALRGQANTAGFQRLLTGALELDAAAEYAAASSSSVRNRFGHLRGATVAMLTQLAVAQSLREHLAARPDLDDPLVGKTAGLLDTIGSAPKIDPDTVAALRAEVRAALSEAVRSSDDGIPPRLPILAHLDRLLEGAHDALVRQALFSNEKAPSSRLKLSFHVDHLLALHNGIRTFVAIVIGSWFWIATAWPSGPSFIVILGVICALFATRPNPVAGGMGFLKGGLVAVLAAALCNFAILPMLSDFTELAVVIGIIMFATGLAMRNARTAALATSFAFLFLDLVGPDNTSRADAASFLNGALALLLGVGAGVLVFMLLFPSNLPAKRRRLQRATRRDLADIGRTPYRWTREHWLSRTVDRLSGQAATNAGVPEKQAEGDLRGMLAALTIGEAAITLAELAREHPRLSKPLNAVLRRLGRGDPAGLAKVSRDAANHLSYWINEPDAPARHTLIRAATQLDAVASAASNHADFLSGKRAA
ncbi:FUSC family protein [Rhizobium lusitanum]|uniref:FUSC family protein n=1 Tax=Rhizobium lusitanum TaxID=293958 RepID=A0A6L9U3V5_9HYPH|nr:FUSC family protein [Rhizobium lusitanum]NEI69188.1 FUSC family protein [Rhizobium lusitanum]